MVFTAGSNKKGQLGDPSRRVSMTFSPIDRECYEDLLAGEMFVSASCGAEFTVLKTKYVRYFCYEILKRSQGRLFVCGANDKGQLGYEGIILRTIIHCLIATN